MEKITLYVDDFGLHLFKKGFNFSASTKPLQASDTKITVNKEDVKFSVAYEQYDVELYQITDISSVEIQLEGE